MKIAIIYSSLTNNTKLLADAIYNKYQNDVVYFGRAKDYSNCDADLYFLGSWTDKGDVSQEMINVLNKLFNKNIFIFGTCGFGGSKEYYESLFTRFKNHLDKSNKIIGHFYCQGKMPLSVKERYINLIKQNPLDKNLKVSLKNFDKALNHPNKNDIDCLLKEITYSIEYLSIDWTIVKSKQFFEMVYMIYKYDGNIELSHIKEKLKLSQIDLLRNIKIMKNLRIIRPHKRNGCYQFLMKSEEWLQFYQSL